MAVVNRHRNGNVCIMSCQQCRRIICSWILFMTVLALVGGSIQKLPRLCWKENEGPKCEKRSSAEKVTCRVDFESRYRQDFWDAKVVVLCFWSKGDINPEDILEKFPLVRKLVVSHGNVSRFVTDFPPSAYLESVTMNDLPLRELPPNLFSSLKNLTYLDLRNNRLKNIPFATVDRPVPSPKILLTGNPWDCSSDLKWILKPSIKDKLVNSTQILCGDTTYSGKPVHSVMYLLEEMRRECPDDICSCSMHNMVWDTNKSYLIPVITRNNITEMLSLVKDKMYDDIADIYLDFNRIEDISVLEGALWLTKCRVLSLRGNLLKEIPTYALDNAFERNANLGKIYLGNNPWKCDCMFTSEFQNLLIKYRSVIKDKEDIRCAEGGGVENSLVPILQVALSSVCTPTGNEINPLDIFSGIFAFLIVLIVGKLVYDYWMYKRSGEVPWIVTKLP